jgi:hypothetical protein
MSSPTKCRCCDLGVPDECSGQIEDHCTWCGTSMDPQNWEYAIPQQDYLKRFCTIDCLVDNERWDEA